MESTIWKLKKAMEGGDAPRITKRLDFKDYHNDYAGNHLDIWINWSRAHNDRTGEAEDRMTLARLAIGEDMQDILKRAKETLGPDDALLFEAYITKNSDEREALIDAALQELFEVTAAFWSCDVEDVQFIWDADVDLWNWVMEQSVALRNEFKATRKKVVKGTGTT